jgi:NMD protein affecting ribosome stability and mRNA decay
MTTILEPVTLEVTQCCSCGITYAAPRWWMNARREDKGTIHCPNGHTASYRESATDRAEKAARRAQELLAHERQRSLELKLQVERAERQASAARGQVTKMKRRAAAGVCPCCNRTFKQLAAHMKDQHPDFTKQEAAQ